MKGDFPIGFFVWRLGDGSVGVWRETADARREADTLDAETVGLTSHVSPARLASNVSRPAIFTSAVADVYDRDQFLYPNDGWKDDAAFQADCLVYALFSGQNRIKSSDGVNHWIPFTEEEVGAKDCFASHFMSDFINGRAVSTKPPIAAASSMPPYQGDLFAESPDPNSENPVNPVKNNSAASAPLRLCVKENLSSAARAVLDAGLKLWRYYHAQPDANPNASYYDIRAYFQGCKPNGAINARWRSFPTRRAAGVEAENFGIIRTSQETSMERKKYMKRFCIIQSCLIAAVCGLTAFGAPQKDVESTPAAKMDARTKNPKRDPGIFGDYWWANRFLSRNRLVEQHRGKTVDLVLLGDSIMHFWEWRCPKSWKKLTQGRTVINLGYGGDRTQNVLWRIAHGELDGYTAKNVVLMIGTNNNTSNDTDPANVAKAIEKIAAEVRAKQPGAQLILHPIFPRGVSADSKRHAAARARNDRTNELLKAFAAAHPEITWIDFNDKMVDSTGWVPRTIMADEVHPTDAGYDIWMDALLPSLK